MAVYRKMKVEIPSRTYRQKKGDSLYVYIYTQFFRKKDGRTSNKSVCIGVVCADDKSRMHPNDMYFTLFGGEGVRVERSVAFFGYTHLAKRILDDLGVTRILTSHLGDEGGRRALASLVYMVGNQSSVMYHLPEWMELEHMPWAGGIISDKEVSDTFLAIGKDPTLVEEVKKDWIVTTGDQEASYFYDVTSISLYSHGNGIAEFGYNRDGEKLLQINMGLFTSQATGLPVYYRRYEGSITDKSDMEYAINNIGMLGINRIKAVMDGGFCTEPNIHFLAEHTDGFTIGLPSGLNVAKALYAAQDFKELQKASNMLSGNGEYGVAVETGLYGVEGRALICFNPDIRRDFVSSYLEKARLTSELLDSLKAEHKKPTDKQLKTASAIYSVILDEAGCIDSYELKADVMDEKFSYSGFFSIFTDDMTSKPAEILRLYREKDEDEKCFCQDKVFLGGRRTRVHDLVHLDGKLLVQFFALVLRRRLLKGLSTILDGKNDMALPKLIRKLDKVGYILSGDQCELLNAGSKIVKDAYAAFGYDFYKEFETVRKEAVMQGSV